MKKIYLCLWLATFSGIPAVKAQTIPTTQPVSIAASSSGTTKTSSDVKSFSAIAWDGSSPGIYYDGPAVGTGILPLPAGFQEPDLVIASTNSNSSTDAFILVAGKLSNNFALVRYQFNGSTFILLPGPTAYGNSPGTLPSSVNLDADISGNVAMVTGSANGAVRVYKGTLSTLSTTTPLSPLAALPANTGQKADVTLSNTGLPTNVHISYLDNSASRVYTNSIPFAGGTFSGPVVVAAGATFEDPRIASPYATSCIGPAVDQYTIVYKKTDISTGLSAICQYSANPDGSINTVTLTSGIAPFPTPTLNNAIGLPVVTFQKNLMSPTPACYAGTVALWMMPNGNISSLLGEKVNTNGTPYGPTAYYTVDPAGTGASCPSVSGKNGSVIVISYVQQGNIYFKQFIPSGPTL